MSKNKWGMILAVVAAVLMLLTTYMALYYAPIPSTSVASAGEILPSVVGSQMRVAGFVCDIVEDYGIPALDVPQHLVFSLADFSDYARYASAEEAGTLDGQWWTVRPIDVASVSGGLSGHGPYISVHPGQNLSVLAEVVEGGAGPNSNATGYMLSSWSGDDFEFAESSGEFGVFSAPIAQKIFYFHMPSAWVSYLAFFFTLVFGALVLRTKDLKYDRWAASAAELGVLFATIAIATGPIWAKQEWGVYWRWDDTKLVTTFILWLVYIGYLMLRASMTEPSKKARVAGVYGIIGFVTVPMSLLSARIAPLLDSSHPVVIASSSGSLSLEAGVTIGVAVAAFTVLFITMLIKRVEVAESEEELEELKRSIGGEE